MRSYYTRDANYGHTSRTRVFCVTTLLGSIEFVTLTKSHIPHVFRWRVVIGEDSAYEMPENWHDAFPGFDGSIFLGGFRVRFPNWFLASCTATVAAVPWIGNKWQFSLRTMLIGMAVVAVLLALIVAIAT